MPFQGVGEGFLNLKGLLRLLGWPASALRTSCFSPGRGLIEGSELLLPLAGFVWLGPRFVKADVSFEGIALASEVVASNGGLRELHEDFCLGHPLLANSGRKSEVGEGRNGYRPAQTAAPASQMIWRGIGRAFQNWKSFAQELPPFAREFMHGGGVGAAPGPSPVRAPTAQVRDGIDRIGMLRAKLPAQERQHLFEQFVGVVLATGVAVTLCQSGLRHDRVGVIQPELLVSACHQRLSQFDDPFVVTRLGIEKRESTHG